jgi:hypothetical protein
MLPETPGALTGVRLFCVACLRPRGIISARSCRPTDDARTEAHSSLFRGWLRYPRAVHFQPRLWRELRKRSHVRRSPAAGQGLDARRAVRAGAETETGLNHLTVASPDDRSDLLKAFQ